MEHLYVSGIRRIYCRVSVFFDYADGCIQQAKNTFERETDCQGRCRKQLWAEAVAFFLPLAIVQPLEIFFGRYVAWAIMFTIGLIFISTHKLWLENIYHRMMARKYENFEAFLNS